MKMFWRFVQIMLIYLFGAISMGLSAYHEADSSLLIFLVGASKMFLWGSYYLAYILVPVGLSVLFFKSFIKTANKGKEGSD